jgi:methyltransferase (TIGR00027 family)
MGSVPVDDAGTEPRIAHSHSDTAEGTAAMRASQSLLPATTRLIDDPVAAQLVRRAAYRLPTRSGLAARLAISILERRCPGLHGHVVLRSRYADDAIRRAGVDQLVMLGAGLDTTAFRLEVDATLFEVDVPTTQRIKRERLASTGLTPKLQTIFVQCTFGVDDLAARLTDAGFDPGRPALYIWLGVVPYLAPDAFDSTMSVLRNLSAPGSGLIVDYVESSVLDGTTTHPGGRRIAQMVARRGEPLQLGFTPDSLREALARYGFTVDEDLGLVDLAARYPATDGPRYTTDGWNRIASASSQ